MDGLLVELERLLNRVLTDCLTGVPNESGGQIRKRDDSNKTGFRQGIKELGELRRRIGLYDPESAAELHKKHYALAILHSVARELFRTFCYPEAASEEA